MMYVGIDEAGELSLLLYPNPTSGLLIIELPSPQVQQVGIFDAKGQLVLSDSIQGGKGNIDLTGVANGVYTVKAGLLQSQLVVRNGD